MTLTGIANPWNEIWKRLKSNLVFLGQNNLFKYWLVQAKIVNYKKIVTGSSTYRCRHLFSRYDSQISLHSYPFTWLLLTGSSACKEELVAQGDLRISYAPSITQSISESYYWYIYPSNNYPNLPYLQKGPFSSNGSTYDTNTSMVITEIKGLNPGNYVFKYYRDLLPQTQTVQVTGGKTNTFTLKNE